VPPCRQCGSAREPVGVTYRVSQTDADRQADAPLSRLVPPGDVLRFENSPDGLPAPETARYFALPRPAGWSQPDAFDPPAPPGGAS
jgi:hypothetical protein